MARFRHTQVPNVLMMESQLAERIGAQLQAMGHTVKSINGAPMGGFQAIMVAPDTGVYRAGSDHRKDGAAVGY
jgi:gamma-glutamyltranspeptidase/glutathione hydrolase